MENLPKLLIINPGSTSTKIAVFEQNNLVCEKKLTHTVDELSAYPNVISQLGFRKDAILGVLSELGLTPSDFACIVGRGGLLAPIESGVYIINDKMIDQLRSGEYGEHASNLGALLASEIGNPHDIPAYIADPVVVDELDDIARLSGHPEIARISIFHALNHKAVGRQAAKSLGKPYDECNLIVTHMGGGISVAAHKKGRCVDVNNALGGEGPYTPERAGGVSAFGLTDMCFSGQTKDEIKKKLVGKGGLSAYLHTNDCLQVIDRIKNGDDYAKLVFEGMAYQTAKEIGAYSTVLRGEIDAIVLTGGLANDKTLTGYITDMVKFIAPVMVFPGEDEMLALCEAGLRVIDKTEIPKII